MKKHREHGQALIILIFALVAMTAMAGLAIDGGRAYTLRRQAQNAADAAALAGTRQLAEYISECTTGSNTEMSEVIIAAARLNGIDHASPDAEVTAWYVDSNENILLAAIPPDSGNAPRHAVVVIEEPPDGATGVRVFVEVAQPTSLLRILGQDTVSASAEATAMTGPIQVTEFSGGGMLPIGFPVQQVDQIIESGVREFTMFDREGAICRRDGVDCPSNPPAQASRGWLNFNYMYHYSWFSDPTAGNADGINVGGSTASPLNRVLATNMSNSNLMEWAEHGAPHPVYFGTRGDASRPDDINDPWRYPLDGDFIVGQPGAREATRKVVCDTHMHRVVHMPVFDYVQQQAYMVNNFDQPSNPLRFPSGQFLYYHIVGFITARLDSCPGRTIEGTFISAVIGEGVIEPDSGYNSSDASNNSCPLETYSVSLWR